MTAITELFFYLLPYLLFGIVLQFIFFELLLNIKKQFKPKIIHSLSISFIGSLISIITALRQSSGGSELASLFVHAMSPFIILFFVLTGLPIGFFYRRRQSSFFRYRSKIWEKNNIPLLVEDTKVHRLCMKVDTTVKFVLLGVKSHLRPPLRESFGYLNHTCFGYGSGGLNEYHFGI